MRLSFWPRTPQGLQELIEDPDREPVARLLDAERARAERLLNYVRGIVLAALVVAAVAYAPRIPSSLHRLNFGVIVPLAVWTIAQHLLLTRRPQVFRQLAVINPIVDITAVSALLVGYGVWGAPVLAVKSPIFLAYFVILAARPMSSSTRVTAAVSALAVAEYTAIVAWFVLTGLVSLTGDPVSSVASPQVSVLDQGARILLLGISGAVSTYATAWHERLLHRALEAQVRQASEQRQLEARLSDADKLAALGTLAASVAHEVSNPLTSITALAEVMRRSATDPEIRADAATIADEARRTQFVIRDLLQVARPRAAEQGPVMLDTVIERALALLRIVLRDAGVTVSTSFDPTIPPVHGDAGRLEQLVINLVINAVQALEATSAARMIHLSTARDATGVLLVVEDTGPGFSPEALPRIFERFFTTKPVGKGTGLGLWIVRQIVEEHRGRIDAMNAAGRGARFEVRLPPAASEPELPAI